MDQNNRKQEILIFFTALTIVGATFASGIQYLKTNGQTSPTTALADVADVVLPAATPVQTPTATTTVATTTTSTTIATTTSSTASGPSSSSAPSAPSKKKPKKGKTIATTTTIVATPAPAPAPAPTATTSAPATKTLSLPYSIGTFNTTFKNGDGWNGWWGNATETDGTIVINADGKNSGGGVLLAGSTAWTDYTFAATLDWLKGQSFNMIARHTDDKNYVACNFDEGISGLLRITVQQYQNGKVVDLGHGELKNYNQIGGSDIIAAIQVKGDQATCSFNNHTVSTLLANTVLAGNTPQGQIGFTAWDPKQGNSEIIVKSASVDASIYDLGLNVQTY